MSKTPKSDTTESIALRAFSLLEAIVAAPGPMSLDDLTLKLKLPKPTVFRIVNLLKDADLLRREGVNKRYTLGTRLVSFGFDLWANNSLRMRWHRALEIAVTECGESCNLTLLEGNRVVYVDRVETSHPLRLHLKTGTRVPLHCTASGKLFLSHLNAGEARQLLGDEPYERFTSKTITDFDALQIDLERVRKTGVGTHDSELFEDSVAIAVPVFGHKGDIVAAIAMHAPSSRASIDTCMGFVDALRKAAAAIASTMSPIE
jgi:IclR family acetate operon transcriptional repressor